jgi:hypothetical protein
MRCTILNACEVEKKNEHGDHPLNGEKLLKKKKTAQKLKNMHVQLFLNQMK